MLFDIHTHSLRPGALVNIDPSELPEGCFTPREPYLYSVGIHPWRVGEVTPALLDELRRLASLPRVLAIGETGLDTLHQGCGDALPAQEALLRQHIALSEQLAKPLILHVVRRFPEIIQLKKQLRPAQPWIIHAFRGKPELARQLLRHGFYLSYGSRFNAASVAATPADRLLLETDDSPLDIAGVSALTGITDVGAAMARIAPQALELGALDGRAPEEC